MVFAAIWRKLSSPSPEPSPADPWDSAEGASILERLSSSNPALYVEIERDRERKRTCDDGPGQADERPAAAGPLHAHEVTAEDAAFVKLMSGAHFGDDVRVTLPSGKTVQGAEMRRWVEGEQ